jgi:DNA-binding CsgD family transcriptional regulator
VDLRALSPRELEILRLVAEGKRTAEIAQALGLSVKSVETYRSRLMQKVGIDNIAGLVRFAIRAGLIAP